MRILRSIHTLNPAAGGPIESVTRSSIVLSRLGHEVEIISLDGPDDPWLGQAGLTVHALGPGRGSYGYAPRFLPWIRQHGHEFDVVLVHGLWQYTSFAVWRGLHDVRQLHDMRRPRSCGSRSAVRLRCHDGRLDRLGED